MYIANGHICMIQAVTPRVGDDIAPAPSYPCPLQFSIGTQSSFNVSKIFFERASLDKPVMQWIYFMNRSCISLSESMYRKISGIFSLLLRSIASSAIIE